MKHDTHHSNTQEDQSVKQQALSRESETDLFSKEVIMVASGVLILALGIGGIWMFSEDEPLHANASKAVDMNQVSKAFHPTGEVALPDKEAAAAPSSVTLVSLEEESASPNEADVYFGFDQATLSEDAKIVIQEKIDNYKENQEWNITVQGHADQKGSDAYNQALGLRRAQAVQAYLTAQGIEDSSIHTESLGSHASICTEDTEDCFQKNRRAHIIVTADQLSASAETPLVTETTESEPENIVTVESDVSDVPLSEEDSSTTTALLSEAVEEMPSSETTTAAESLP